MFVRHVTWLLHNDRRDSYWKAPRSRQPANNSLLPLLRMIFIVREQYIWSVFIKLISFNNIRKVICTITHVLQHIVSRCVLRAHKCDTTEYRTVYNWVVSHAQTHYINQNNKVHKHQISHSR